MFPLPPQTTSFDVICLTASYKGGAPGGCGWDKAQCVLQSNAADFSAGVLAEADAIADGRLAAARSRRHADVLEHAIAHFKAHHEAIRDVATRLRLSGQISVTATCTFYSGDVPTGSKSGPVSPDVSTITFA